MGNFSKIILLVIALLIVAGGIIFYTAREEAVSEPEPPEKEFIRVDIPKPNELITSPQVIRGEARGTWYFEATFPVRLEDANGNIVAQSFAQAQGEWMTENFVPFEGKIEFEMPGADTGLLILEKANPFGLPEHADELIVPVRFR